MFLVSKDNLSDKWLESFHTSIVVPVSNCHVCFMLPNPEIFSNTVNPNWKASNIKRGEKSLFAK